MLDNDTINAKINDVAQSYGLYEPNSFDLSAAERPSIIIMPFKNLSGDDNEGLADGIRLTLHSILIKLPGLYLIHTGTVERYRGQEPSLTSKERNSYKVYYKRQYPKNREPNQSYDRSYGYLTRPDNIE